MQSVSSMIWTRVAVSISYDDNFYPTGTSIQIIYMYRGDLELNNIPVFISRLTTKRLWVGTMKAEKKQLYLSFWRQTKDITHVRNGISFNGSKKKKKKLRTYLSLSLSLYIYIYIYKIGYKQVNYIKWLIA